MSKQKARRLGRGGRLCLCQREELLLHLARHGNVSERERVIDSNRLGGGPASKQRVKAQALAFGHADHSPRRVIGFLTGEVNRRILADKAAADEVTLIADGPASSVVLADEKMIQRLGRLFRLNGACHGR